MPAAVARTAAQSPAALMSAQQVHAGQTAEPLAVLSTVVIFPTWSVFTSNQVEVSVLEVP